MVFHSTEAPKKQPPNVSISTESGKNPCKLDFKVDQFARHRCFSDFASAESPMIRANQKTKCLKLLEIDAPDFPKNAERSLFESFCFLDGMNSSMFGRFWILERTEQRLFGTF
jgi:hypothetical protein